MLEQSTKGISRISRFISIDHPGKQLKFSRHLFRSQGEPKKQIFAENPQIFADSPPFLEIQAFGGRRKPQKTADFRRKPKIFAENRRKPQFGLRHLRCVTFSSALRRTNQTQKHIFADSRRSFSASPELSAPRSQPCSCECVDWRVPNPPGANPLVAERAFPTSDYWGRTGVARCPEEMAGICRDFQ